MKKAATQDGDAETRKEPRAEGIACPDCRCRHLIAVRTRHRLGKINRVRECRNCGRKITTWETLEG